jgi:hypothetical protein
VITKADASQTRHIALTAARALFAKRAVCSRQGQAGADGPVIRLVGDARFSKVAVHRGHYDPSARLGGRAYWRRISAIVPGNHMPYFVSLL